MSAMYKYYVKIPTIVKNFLTDQNNYQKCKCRIRSVYFVLFPYFLSKNILFKMQGDMTHDSYCWLGALPILSVSKTIDPSYKSYGATRPYKHGTEYLLFFLANSHSNLGLINENDL